MIARTVRYTGLEIDPMDLIRGREHVGAIPHHWLRVRFETESPAERKRLVRWLAANIDGRWQCYVTPLSTRKRVVVIAFESDTDAVLFRLKSGETAWREGHDEHV